MAYESTFNAIDNILRNEAGCSTELDYIEQTSWLLFLKYLDDLEAEREMNALMAQNKAMLSGISNIQMQLDSFQESIDGALQDEGDREETARLNELYEKLETCQVKGDTAGAKAVQEQISAIMRGGSSLALA